MTLIELFNGKVVIESQKSAVYGFLHSFSIHMPVNESLPKISISVAFLSQNFWTLAAEEN